VGIDTYFFVVFLLFPVDLEKQLAAKKRRNHKEKKDLRWKRHSPYG